MKKTLPHEFREDDLCSVDGFCPHIRVPKWVDRHNGNHKVISFSCWDQYLRMAFAQRTDRESLTPIPAKLARYGEAFLAGLSDAG